MKYRCAGGDVGQSLNCSPTDDQETTMAKPSSREASKPTGDYIIYVTEAYSLNSNWMPTARYYSGTVLFEAQSGKIHFTHVKRATLKLRMLHFCIPDNPTADAKARAAEHKRYVRALELYREYYRRTGQVSALSARGLSAQACSMKAHCCPSGTGPIADSPLLEYSTRKRTFGDETLWPRHARREGDRRDSGPARDTCF